MARPARVRMRRRKPCVLARRRLLGWNVRLLTVVSYWAAGQDPGGVTADDETEPQNTSALDQTHRRFESQGHVRA
jgi:hypothetical protein